jgi:N-acetylglucosaminyl-diphospho-decaprenol L-rhamnosyltransferase
VTEDERRRSRFSVVVPTRDTRALTLACLDSILSARQAAEVEVVLVDDAGRDGTADAVAARFPRVRVLRNRRPAGFTASVNRGLASVRGEILLLLNSDTEVNDDAWEILDRVFSQRRELGVVGAALHYPDGTPQWSGWRRPTPLWLFGLASGLPALLGRLPGLRAVHPVGGLGGREVEWVTGAAMAFRRAVWQQVGPFDEVFELYCQDLDFCIRSRRAGWEVAVVEDFRVLHHQGATVGRGAGTAGAQDPTLLWRELVRWSGKEGGAPRARRAARALAAGARLRLAARWIGGLFGTGSSRPAWRRESRAYRRALAGLPAEAGKTRANAGASGRGAP